MGYNAICNKPPTIRFEVIDMAVKLAHVNTDDVVNKYRAGISVKDIARDLGVDITTVYDRLNSVGAVINRRANLDSNAVISLYAEGRGMKEIGRMLGTSSYPVREILTNNGIRLRGRIEQIQVARNKVVGEVIIAMTDAGMLSTAIAGALNMSVQNVIDIMRANGITPNSRAFDIPVIQISDLHSAGFNVAEIARMFNVSDTVISRTMDSNGVARRRSITDNRKFNATIKGFDVSKAKAMFDSGVGISGIAKFFNLPAPTVSLAFKDAGLSVRNRSEQQFARMARCSPEERSAITRAANIAATGRIVPIDTKIKTAATCQVGLNRRISAAEITLANMLTTRGIDINQQTAVGPYNCDLTTDAVAVEIWGGYWHFYGAHAARNEERFRYILNAGWNVIILGVTGRYPLNESVADYVVAEIERLRSNPPSIREYRMIWGAGDFTSGGRLDDNKLSFVRPLVRPRNVSSNGNN